jgi:uncharacterized protein YutD
MGYMHIDNLYKNVEILMFKECYALEKIHGTSAHVSWKQNQLHLSPGGELMENFRTCFDETDLQKRLSEQFTDVHVVIYGEAYGGLQQAMSGTYGDETKFVVFDVTIDGLWLSVPNAHDVATKLGLEFVDYVKCTTDIETLNAERDKPSTQAIRNGCGNDKLREGVVLRPLIELRKNNNSRIVCKHKRDEFRETKTPRLLTDDELKVLEDAKEIADEWVTRMRLSHVLDKLNNPNDERLTGTVIKAMVEDVKREAEGEIVISKEALKEIGKLTSKLYREYMFKRNTKE